MNNDNRDNPDEKERIIDRRKILLGGTTLAAASTLAAGLPTLCQSPAQAQPAPSGQRPNILVIWGDDVGIANVSAYSFAGSRALLLNARPYKSVAAIPAQRQGQGACRDCGRAHSLPSQHPWP